MTQSKHTKRALLASILSVVLCVAMLVGSTFAWFTDSVTSGNNKIVAGNLDVKLEYSTDLQNWEDVDTNTNVFKDGTLWEPGYTEVVYLRVSNAGSLALKYKFAIHVADKVIGQTADGKEIDLSNFIKFGVVAAPETAYSQDAAGRAAAREAVATDAQLISAGYSKEGAMVKNADPEVLAMVVYMPEDVGNEANHGTGKQAPSIDMGISLVATQDTVEKDSFGNDYDEDAAYPIEYAATEAQLKDAIANVENGGAVILTDNIQLSEAAPITVEDGKSVTVDMNGKTLTNAKDIWNQQKNNWSVFSVRGGELTITGNGTVQAKENDSYVADLQYGGKLTIESGTFIGNISAVYVHTGELIINGGTFNIQQLEDGTGADQYRFMLNCYDQNYENDTAKITVNGGRFHVFNPADNAAEGKGTNFVAAGLSVVENDGWYTVGKAAANAEELGEAVEQGGTVILTENVSLSSPLALSDEKVQINLNGKELKSTATLNLINATGSADVTVSGGKLSVDNKNKASVVFAQDSAKVCIENCDIIYPQGMGYAVSTNGSQSKDAAVVMRNTNITANQNYACYFPAGTITMENCNVTGAVIISGGDVTIDGGTYTADGYSGQPKIWHKDDTISYMKNFAQKDGCGHMGDAILIMDRRSSGYGAPNVTIRNATFNTELTLKDGSKAAAYAIKYVDYNNIPDAERGRLNITGNTYNHKLAGGQEPLMFIGIDGTDIAYPAQ